MTSQERGLGEAHDCGDALPGVKRAGEEPVLATSERLSTGSCFRPVVVDRDLAVVPVRRERPCA